MLNCVSLAQASIVPPSMTKEVIQSLHGMGSGQRSARLLQRSLIAIVLLVVGCVLAATAGTDPVTMRISTHAMIQLDALPHNEHIP